MLGKNRRHATVGHYLSCLRFSGYQNFWVSTFCVLLHEKRISEWGKKTKRRWGTLVLFTLFMLKMAYWFKISVIKYSFILKTGISTSTAFYYRLFEAFNIYCTICLAHSWIPFLVHALLSAMFLSVCQRGGRANIFGGRRAGHSLNCRV